MSRRFSTSQANRSGRGTHIRIPSCTYHLSAGRASDPNPFRRPPWSSVSPGTLCIPFFPSPCASAVLPCSSPRSAMLPAHPVALLSGIRPSPRSPILRPSVVPVNTVSHNILHPLWKKSVLHQESACPSFASVLACASPQPRLISLLPGCGFTSSRYRSVRPQERSRTGDTTPTEIVTL